MGQDDDERADDAERSLFLDAMQGVQPLAERRRGPGSSLLDAARGARRPRSVAEPRRSQRIEVEALGEEVRGVAAGVDERAVWRLRDEGRFDLRLDLHGLDREGAREWVERRLLQAYLAGERRVLLVHGRGLRSAAGPVLKRWLPVCLSSPPLDKLVLAFTTAGARQGGSGATLVLLRKRRRD